MGYRPPPLRPGEGRRGVAGEREVRERERGERMRERDLCFRAKLRCFGETLEI